MAEWSLGFPHLPLSHFPPPPLSLSLSLSPRNLVSLQKVITITICAAEHKLEAAGEI